MPEDFNIAPEVLQLASALSGQESGGNYRPLKPRTGATGRWQILPGNIPRWSKKVLGRAVSVNEFENSPEIQDRVALGMQSEMLARNSLISKTPIEAQQRTALEWYSGSNTPEAFKKRTGRDWSQRNPKYPKEPSPKEYVSQVTARLTGANVPKISATGLTPRKNITALGTYDPAELPYPQPANPDQVNANVAYLSSRPAPVAPEEPVEPSVAPVVPAPVIAQPTTFAPPRHPVSKTQINLPAPRGQSLSGLPQEAPPDIREGDYRGPTQLAPKPQPRQGPNIAPPQASTDVNKGNIARYNAEATIGPVGGVTEDEYRADYRENKIAQTGMSEDAYVSHRTRQAAIASLDKAGKAGHVLATIIGEGPANPANDALTKFSLNATNSLLGGLPQAINPEAFLKANEALDLGEVGNIVTEHGGSLAGTLVGLKGAKAILEKAAAPLIEKLSAPVVEGLSGALWQSPSEAAQVADGKPVGEALKSIAVTGAQFGLIGPAAKYAEDISKVAAPLGGSEAAVWNTVANAALQTSVMAGGEYANTGTVSPETILTGLALSMPQVREANKKFKNGPEIDIEKIAERYPIPQPKIKTIDELTSGIGQEFVARMPEPFVDVKPPVSQSLIPKGESNAITTGKEPSSDLIEHPRVDESIPGIGEDRQYSAAQQRTRLADFTGDSGTGSGNTPEAKPLSGRAQKRADKDFIANFNPSSIEDAALHFIAEGNKFNLPEIKRDVFGSNLKVGGRKGTSDIPSSFLNVADNKGITVDRFITDYLPGKLGQEELSPKQQMDARDAIHNAIGKIASRGDAVKLLKERAGGNEAKQFEQMQRAYAEPIESSDIAQAEVVPEFEAAFYGGKQQSMFGEVRVKSELEQNLDERIGLAEKSVKEARKIYDQKKKEAASAILGGASEKYANEALKKYEDSAKAAEDILLNLKVTRDERIQKIRGSEQSLFEQADYGGGASAPEELTASTAPDKTPTFADNTPVYTYAVNAEGGIANPLPIKGKIVTKEMSVRDETGRWAKDADGNPIKVKRQFINPGNGKLVPVDEHTQPIGKPHPLTQSLRGENAPSTFVISRLGNDIAKSWGSEGVNYILTGKGKPGSVKMGPEGTNVNLHRNIFVDPNLASGVSVHEIGHIADYSGPELTMERGNIVGHIQALRNDLTNSDLSKALRSELIELSRTWHPFEKTSKAYIEQRTTSKELVADAIGAMINDPELVRRIAPKFHNEYNNFLDARPETKAVFDNLSKALHGDEIALGKMAQDYLHQGYDQAEIFRQLSEDATDAKGRKLIQGDNWWNTYSASDKLAVRAIRVAEKELKQAGLTHNDHAEYAEIVRKQGVEAANAWLDRPTISLKKGKTVERAAYTEVQKQAIRKAAALFGEGEAEWPKQLALNHSLRTTGDQQAAMVHYWEHDVYTPLKDAGVTLNEFGDYLTATAVLGNYRAGLANPGALDAQAAQAVLATLRHDLKPEAYTLLESKVRSMRDQMVSLMEDAHLEGLISDETMTTVHNNSDSYARFASAEKAARNVRFSRVQAIGTLNEIQNPALSLPLQMLDVRQKIAYQKATKNLVGLITEMGETAEVNESFSQHPGGNNTIAYYDKGKRVEVTVDPYYSSMYHYAPEQFTGKVAQAVRFLLDKTRNLQSGLLIRFSLPFQFKNPLKDAAETYQNIGLGVFKHYPTAYKEARAAQKGKLTGAAREAYTHGVVREFNASGRASYEKPPNPQRALLEAAGARERIKAQPVSRLTDLAAKIFGSNFWESLEAVPKLAAREYYLEKGYTPEMADYLGATLSGTPDTRIRGKATRSVGSLFLFANVNAQGKLRTARLIKNPRTNSAYAVRTLVTMAPKLLMYAAASRLAYTAAEEVFGEDNPATDALRELHELYQYVGDYFLSNYLVIPYGFRINARGDKVAQTVTLPISETDQLLSSFLQPVFNQASDNTRNFSDFVAEFGHSAGNIIPSLGPVEHTVMQWSEYLMKENPDDPFYGTNVLSDQQFAVSKNDIFASDPLKRMAENSLRNLFGGQYRMIQSFADIDKPFEFMSFYRETRSGLDEKTRRLKRSSEAATAAGQLTRSVIVKQGPDAIQEAYDLGNITEKQYKSMLKKAANPSSIYSRMTDDELNEALDEMRYDPTTVEKITTEINRRADN